MKIAIISLPLKNNYGGILQAWALQKSLSKLGYDSELIMPNFIKNISFIKKLYLYPLRACRKYVLKTGESIHRENEINRNYFEYLKLNKKIQEFIDHNINYKKINSIKEIKKNDYDAVVIGSDQIWRAIYNVNFDKNRLNSFGWFARHWHKPIISYAASFGIDSLSEYSDKELRKISKLLKKFRAISVREKSGVELCSELGVNATQLLDPTMLLESREYSKFIGEDLHSMKGIISYILDTNCFAEKLINHFTEITGLPHFQLKTSDVKKPSYPLSYWLKGFNDGDFVITDSFHACVFSILYGKPFIVIENPNRGNSRIQSLLTMFGLEHHLIKESSDISIKNIDDYRLNPEEINKVLKEERSKAIQFINKNLSADNT